MAETPCGYQATSPKLTALKRNYFYDRSKQLVHVHSLNEKARRIKSFVLFCFVLFCFTGDRFYWKPIFATKNGVKHWPDGPLARIQT